MSNNPKVLAEFSVTETVWLLDLLHSEWARRVIHTAIVPPSFIGPHIALYHKAMATRLLNRVERDADNQGFGNL